MRLLHNDNLYERFFRRVRLTISRLTRYTTRGPVLTFVRYFLTSLAYFSIFFHSILLFFALIEKCDLTESDIERKKKTHSLNKQANLMLVYFS